MSCHGLAAVEPISKLNPTLTHLYSLSIPLPGINYFQVLAGDVDARYCEVHSKTRAALRNIPTGKTKL